MITRGLEKLRRLGLVFCLLVGAGPLSAVSVTEPFFPIGIYGVGSTEHLQQVHEAGFNTVVGPANKAFLDQAQALGIQVIASPGASAGRDFDPSKFEGKVIDYDHHPALHSWYLVDEPDMTRTPPWQVAMDQRLFKAHAARKPTSLVLFDGVHARDYGAIPDILMVDSYPIPWMPLAHFSQHMTWARSIAGPAKPLYAIAQAFDWYAFRDAVPGETRFRVPTHEELKCMTYLALAQPVDGLLFFTFASGKWFLPDHPDLWHGLLDIVQSLHQHSYLLGCKRLPWVPSYKIAPYEKRRSETQEPSIHLSHLRDAHGTEHLMLINTTEHPLTLSLSLPSSGQRWQLAGSPSKTPFGGFRPGSLYEIPFEKYEVRILQGIQVD